MPTRYKPNPAGFDQLKRRAQTAAAMEDIGEQIVRKVDSLGGRFTHGYTVDRETVDNTAGVRVGTAYPFAHWDEWGTRYRAPRAPLRRALASLGLLGKTKEKGKP